MAKEQKTMTKAKAIKKHFEKVKEENNPLLKDILIALLMELGRDLLTVEQYEKIFNVELLEH